MANGKALNMIRRMLGERVIDGTTMLICDEAQHLKIAALEWLRALCEQWCTDLVLACDTDLLRKVATIPRLHSRCGARS